jgi:SAM-dependent methyltransferase
VLLPKNVRVLDVGCGDGNIDRLIMERRPDVSIEGIDVLERRQSYIPVTLFDGNHIPHMDNSYDVVMFIDVIHHADDQIHLLQEAKRVSNKHLLIKDHLCNGVLAFNTLKFMDWVGNCHHGVRLPYNYWSSTEWKSNFKNLSLEIQSWSNRLRLYSLPASWLFDRSLHFISLLSK